MLAKKQRLTAVQVREIIKNGRSARTATLSAKFKAASPSKAAVVVSIKTAKSAVMRNKLRRSAYATLRASLPKGIHAVFFLHKPILDTDELNSLCLKLF